MRRILLLILVLAIPFTVAASNVLPNPDAGQPLTGQWILVLGALLILGTANTVAAKLMVSAVNRAVERRVKGKAEQEEKLSQLGTQLSEFKLEGARRDLEHDRQLHELEIKMHECRGEHGQLQSTFVTRENHHGDFLRLEAAFDRKAAEIMDSFRALHKRIDDVLVGPRKPAAGGEQ